jgi:hypothetical protein
MNDKKFHCTLLALLALGVLLPACSGTQSPRTVAVVEQALDPNASGKEEQEYLLNTLQRKQHATYSVRQEEAKLFDVPIPLEVRPLERYIGSDAACPISTFLAYALDIPMLELHSFYTTQMERFGWRKSAEFIGPELVLVFEKPHRSCMIAIRSRAVGRHKGSSSELIIMLGQR